MFTPYTPHLDTRYGYLTEQLAQEAADAEFRELRDAAERNNTDTAAPAQASNGLEAAAEYRADDTDEF
ncbi:hypothetical protein DMB66_27680 [Actinoplanes sp. ATCC 53533]|uniref:hypothetical protein n=1 Tax=Actinoplanes sp. ATCC 53533 TaxID=1288362 RepID=UPI000F788DED|nr:hypothetical protein [Actinoplanes sp. ATCC 53533]RSM59469.1 hypothetical protein DMB66_27680 [Actinoplanes sp. ATCC 53533]